VGEPAGNGWLYPEVQEYRSTGVQEFRSTGVQEFRSSGVQEFRSRQENPECEEEHVIG
jgi:hypothetical protein